MKVLIAEDNVNDRKILMLNIKRHGCEVVAAEDGEEALRLAAEHQPDLIISDALMPQMDGFELLRRLKQEKNLAAIPFVFYSAVYTGKKEEELALSLGAEAFIVKPMEPEAFWLRLQEICEIRKTREMLPPAGLSAGQEDFIRRYSRIVATKLEEKVRELARAKEKIETDEQRFSLLFYSMRDTIIITDQQRNIINANPPALRKMFGYELEEIKGKKTRILYADEPSFVKTGQELFDQKEELAGKLVEVLMMRKNGEIFPAEISVFKISAADNASICKGGLIRDITERKKAEEEIKKSGDEWQLTFDSISDIVTIQDMDFRIKRCNKATYHLLQTSPEQVINKPCFEVFRSASSPCKNCPTTRIFNSRDTHEYSVEITHPTLQKTFQVTASPIYSEKGRMHGVVHFAKDITKQKELETHLRQAQKLEAIGTLAGGIAHDFNNILTAILGYADLVRMNAPENATIHSDIQQIHKAGMRAKELVRQILTFSRQAEEVHQPVKIQHIIKEALKLLRASIPASIEIRRKINEDCQAIMADATGIHQIIMNLCTNSYHAMRDTGGVIEISLKTMELDSQEINRRSLDLQPGQYAQLSISDTGCGMDKPTMERIFDPYFTTKNKGEGSGLGLAVVYGIVKGYGGAISVASMPEKGTTFTLHFPVAERGNPLDIKHESEKMNLPGGTERIMVVDDELAITQMLRKILERLGYAVTSFTSSVEAMQYFTEHSDRFDLVISDQTMPEIMGDELAIRLLQVRPDIPIVICSGFSERINGRKAGELGIKEYVMKPLIPADMARMIRQVLDAAQNR
ncbi:MAG: response regulator [Thermodesulfobacteriota bacterium]